MKLSLIVLITLGALMCFVLNGWPNFLSNFVFDTQVILAIASICTAAFAAIALIISFKTLKAQKKSGELQRFESTFFNMMTLQEQITSQLKVETKKSIANPYCNFTLSPLFLKETIINKGREAIECLWKCKEFSYYDEKEERHTFKGLKGAMYGAGVNNYDQFFEISILDHYFRHMYRIVKFVDGAKCLSDEEKYEYVSILRATLSRYELVWLFYNGLSLAGREKFKPLMEKYSLLKNLRRGYLTTSKEVINDKPLRMLVANNYKDCKGCMDYYAYMTDEEVNNKEYEDKGMIPPYNISVFAKKGSKLYEKVLGEYNDYKRALKASKETGYSV